MIGPQRAVGGCVRRDLTALGLLRGALGGDLLGRRLVTAEQLDDPSLRLKLDQREAKRAATKRTDDGSSVGQPRSGERIRVCQRGVTGLRAARARVRR